MRLLDTSNGFVDFFLFGQLYIFIFAFCLFTFGCSVFRTLLHFLRNLLFERSLFRNFFIITECYLRHYCSYNFKFKRIIKGHLGDAHFWATDSIDFIIEHDNRVDIANSKLRHFLEYCFLADFCHENLFRDITLTEAIDSNCFVNVLKCCRAVC